MQAHQSSPVIHDGHSAEAASLSSQLANCSPRGDEKKDSSSVPPPRDFSARYCVSLSPGLSTSRLLGIGATRWGSNRLALRRFTPTRTAAGNSSSSSREPTDTPAKPQPDDPPHTQALNLTCAHTSVKGMKNFPPQTQPAANSHGPPTEPRKEEPPHRRPVPDAATFIDRREEADVQPRRTDDDDDDGANPETHNASPINQLLPLEEDHKDEPDARQEERGQGGELEAPQNNDYMSWRRWYEWVSSPAGKRLLQRRLSPPPASASAVSFPGAVAASLVSRPGVSGSRARRLATARRRRASSSSAQSIMALWTDEQPPESPRKRSRRLKPPPPSPHAVELTNSSPNCSNTLRRVHGGLLKYKRANPSLPSPAHDPSYPQVRNFVDAAGTPPANDAEPAGKVSISRQNDVGIESKASSACLQNEHTLTASGIHIARRDSNALSPPSRVCIAKPAGGTAAATSYSCAKASPPPTARRTQTARQTDLNSKPNAVTTDAGAHRGGERVVVGDSAPCESMDEVLDDGLVVEVFHECLPLESACPYLGPTPCTRPVNKLGIKLAPPSRPAGSSLEKA
eukprot:GHVT01045771.1.p1 GENE.GHVT01045771.1~~GHVT01045771.1.p1  ORF type:complete len:570 (+),score=101.48 GHVT01045771.1:229-1938(+)